MSAVVTRRDVERNTDHLPLSEIHADAGAPRDCGHAVRGPRRPHVGADEHALGHVALEAGGDEGTAAISHASLVFTPETPRSAVSGERERNGRHHVFALTPQLQARSDEGVRPGVLDAPRL